MPTGRSGVAAGVVNGELYIFGGEMPRLFGEVEVYNPVQNRWRELAPMPTPRHGIFAAVFDNAIHLAGGANQQGLSPTTTHEVFLVNGGNPDYYPCPNFQYTRIVPIVLDVTTGAAHFTTEMTLINTGFSMGQAGGTGLNLSLHYTASLGDQLGSGTVTDILAGFEQKVIPNVLS